MAPRQSFTAHDRSKGPREVAPPPRVLRRPIRFRHGIDDDASPSASSAARNSIATGSLACSMVSLRSYNATRLPRRARTDVPQPARFAMAPGPRGAVLFVVADLFDQREDVR